MVVYLIDYEEGKQNEKGQVSEDSKKQVNPRYIKVREKSILLTRMFGAQGYRER